MRDPWLPIVMMAIVLLGVWLGIFGPLPNGIIAEIQKWQTLLAAAVALVAAYIAFSNTDRTLNQNERLERQRRSRKHAALRAILPVALAQLQDYAEKSARALDDLVEQCANEKLPPGAAPESMAMPVSPEILETLINFIEYSDGLDVGVLESTIAWIQIHDSRIRRLVETNRDPSEARIVLRTELEGRVIDAASIYAGAASMFEYARRRDANLPALITWDDVRRAMRNMRFWEDEYPRIYDAVVAREKETPGPFHRLKA